jgi:hypothetical protein
VRRPRPRRDTGGQIPFRSRAAIALGVFAAIQTFVFFARRDRFSVLFWWTSESWLLVTLLWLKDLALAAAAFLVFRSLAHATERLPAPAEPSSRKSLRHALLFVAILAAGTALRWVAPRQIPPGVWVDPLIEVHQILRHPGSNGWLGGWPRTGEGSLDTAVVSSLYLKFCEFLFQIFGRGDLGILALSAVGGTLALPALYCLAREVEGPRIALVATAILAFSAWPLVLSRWTWTAAMMCFLVLSASAAILAALRKQSAGWALAAGIFVGLSLHTHPAAWPVAAGFGLFALWSLRRPRVLRLTGVAVLGTFLAFAPLGFAFLRFPERLGGRARDVSFLRRVTDTTVPGAGTAFALPAALFYNAWQYSGLVLWTADPNPRHDLPARSRLHPIIGIAALVGAALAWKRAQESDERQVLVLLLAVSGLLAGVLSNPTGAPNSFRTSALVAPLAIWSAAALGRWTTAAARLLGARESFLWSFALCLLLTFETDSFLRRWPEDGLVRASFAPADSSAGRMLRELAPHPTILDPGALSMAFVTETLSANADPRVPVPRLPRWTPEFLVANPPARPFWYVTTSEGLDTLRRKGWRCGRDVRVAVEVPQVVIARVAPCWPAGRSPGGGGAAEVRVRASRDVR